MGVWFLALITTKRAFLKSGDDDDVDDEWWWWMMMMMMINHHIFKHHPYQTTREFFSPTSLTRAHRTTRCCQHYVSSAARHRSPKGSENSNDHAGKSTHHWLKAEAVLSQKMIAAGNWATRLWGHQWEIQFLWSQCWMLSPCRHVSKKNRQPEIPWSIQWSIQWLIMVDHPVILFFPAQSA